MSCPEIENLRIELLFAKQKLVGIAAAHNVFHKSYPFVGIPQTLEIACDALQETIKVCETWTATFDTENMHNG